MSNLKITSYAYTFMDKTIFYIKLQIKMRKNYCMIKYCLHTSLDFNKRRCEWTIPGNEESTD